MAIENQTETTPTDVETSELLQTIDTVQESANFEVMPDGSAVEMTEETEVMEVGFYDNLAEVLDPGMLNSIANELRDGLEKDKSSREDWEKTYTDGLKYLGMRFDEERSEPFSGASGVIHPLLGEAVTSFQAQAYKELLPAGGPVKTNVVGAYDSAIEEQAQRVREFMNYQIVHVMEEFDE